MPTMKDIAKEAGVSHGTVSNVLNKTGKVSIEKIKLVEAAAKKLGYVPNAQAQLLRQGNATVIALIVPSLREDLYMDLYTSLQIAFASSKKTADYSVHVYTTDDICEHELSILDRLPVSNILSVVTVSSLKRISLSRNPYQSLPCPVFYIDRSPAELRDNDHYISFDKKQIGIDLANYISHNHFERIAFFSASGINHCETQLFIHLQNALSNSSVTLEHFSSDMNLSLTKAFDLLQEEASYDLVITTSILRADAVINAVSLAHCNMPHIMTFASLARIPHGHFHVYELDYTKIGMKIYELLSSPSSQDKRTTSNHILKPKGLPFLFTNIKKAEKETLSILTLDTPSTEALKKLAPLFETISGVHLKVVSMPYNDLHQQIPLMTEQHHYDLIRIDVAMLDTLGESTYLPLTSCLSLSDIDFSSLISTGYTDNSFPNYASYALPFDLSTQIFLYRKDLFEDATICRAFYEHFHEKLTVPSNCRDFLKIAEFFTESYNTLSPTLYGTTMTSGAASIIASDFMPYLFSENTKETITNLCQNKEHLLSAMKQYLQMTHYATQQPWWLDSVSQFINGNAATTIIYSNYAPYIINSKHSDVVGKVGASIVPGKHPLIGGGVIGISKYSKKIEACHQFFQWYYSEEVSSLMMKLGGTSPLTTSYTGLRNLDLFPWLHAVKKSFDLGSRGCGKQSGCSIQQFEFSIGTSIRNLLLGNISPNEACEWIQNTF